MRNAKSENHSLRLGAANTGFVLNPVPTSPGSTLTHARAAFRHPLIMSSCVTPGGVRRIRESIDGPLSDVSVQVRPHRRRSGLQIRRTRECAREFRKAARASPETRGRETRDGFRARAPPRTDTSHVSRPIRRSSTSSPMPSSATGAHPKPETRAPIATAASRFLNPRPVRTRETTVCGSGVSRGVRRCQHSTRHAGVSRAPRRRR